MNAFKFVKIKMSTIFVLIMAAPSLFYVSDYLMFNWEPVHFHLTSNQHEYQQNFRIFHSETIYCMQVELERPSREAIATSKTPYKDSSDLFKLFDFDWLIYENNIIVSSGNSKAIHASMGWSDVISFEFNCFLVKPFKKYEVKVNLRNSPSEKLNTNLNSKFSIVLNRDEGLGRSVYLVISLLWLLLLSSFVVFNKTPATFLFMLIILILCASLSFL